MKARATRYVLTGVAAALLAMIIAFWRFTVAPATVQSSAPALAVPRDPTGSDTPTTLGSTGGAAGFDSVRTVAGMTGATVPPEPPVLPPAPTGDYEIAVTDSQLQAIVQARYGPFIRTLTLPPATTARLRDLLVERQHAAIDVANAAMVAGLNSIRDLALIKQAIALAEQDVDADLAHEFGTPVLFALREFESTRAERNTVDDLARVLATSGDPLRPAQQQRLVRILRESPTMDIPVDINGVLYGRYDRRAEVSAGVIAAAAAELSPRQLNALRGLQPAGPTDGPSAQ